MALTSTSTRSLFGEVGAAIPFSVREVGRVEEVGRVGEVGKVEEVGRVGEVGRAVVEVADSGVGRVRAALALQATYQGRPACLATTRLSNSYTCHQACDK